MSWFTDLAGKAEDFLNKVDQGAATALTKNQSRSSSFSASYEGGATFITEYDTAGHKADTTATQHAYTSSHETSSYISAAAGNIKKSNVTATPSGSGSTVPNSAKSSSSFVRPKKSEENVDDDMLFDFLNSSDPPVGSSSCSSRRDSRRELVKAAAPGIEAQNPTPPPSAIPHTIPSAPSTPPSTHSVSRASSMSSLSAHSIKISDESSAKEPGQGTVNKICNTTLVITMFVIIATLYYSNSSVFYLKVNSA